MEDKICEHLSAIKKLKHAEAYVCEECVKHGGTWLHLRTCQTCGVTLCCDSSPAKHASQHARETGHPVVLACGSLHRPGWLPLAPVPGGYERSARRNYRCTV